MFTLARKFFFAPVLMAAAALASNTVAAAQTHVVKVPFSFMVGHKVCPAGSYIVAEDPSSNVVKLQAQAGKRNFSWLIGPGDPSPLDSRILLTFDKVGDTYALRTVQYRSGITNRLDNIERMEVSSHRVLTVEATAGE